MEITVYGELRAAAGGKTVELEGEFDTVGDALEGFLEAYPRAESRLLEDGELRPSVRVMLDGERVDTDANCPPDARLQLFPAMQGGVE